MAEVIERFRWSSNGHDIEQLEVGDIRDFGTLTDGLVEAGLVAGADAAPVAVVDKVVEPITDKPVEQNTTTTTKKPFQKRR